MFKNSFSFQFWHFQLWGTERGCLFLCWHSRLWLPISPARGTPAVDVCFWLSPPLNQHSHKHISEQQKRSVRAIRRGFLSSCALIGGQPSNEKQGTGCMQTSRANRTSEFSVGEQLQTLRCPTHLPQIQNPAQLSHWATRTWIIHPDEALVFWELLNSTARLQCSCSLYSIIV